MYTVKQIVENYIIWGIGADYSNHKRLLIKFSEAAGGANAANLTSDNVYHWASGNYKRPTMLAALQIIKRAWNFAWKPTTLQESTIRYTEQKCAEKRLPSKRMGRVLTGVLTEYDNPLYGIGLNYKNYKREHYTHEEEFFKALLYQCVECSQENWKARQALKAIHNKE